MKTYNKTTTEPRLVIQHDENPESPREWSNLGYFITIDREYHSPDENETLQRIIKDTGEEAESLKQHIEMITEQYQEQTGQHVEAIYPVVKVVKYEHGGVIYSLGEKHGWDLSNNGFYIITTESQKEIGTDKKDFEKVIEHELKVFNKYANGEIYRFELYNDKGELEDSCCGFYDVADIKDHLPKEWENEDLEKYIID